MRDGELVRAFVGYATHLQDEPVWWCPTRDAFVSPFHGEAYDTAGRILYGPAQRALDELPVIRDGRDFLVYGEPVATGAPVDDERARSDRAWDPVEGPGFCPSPVK